MIWTTDADGVVTYMSPGWYEFTGQVEPEALNKGWAAALHPDHRSQAIEAFAAVRAQQVEFSMVYQLRRRTGDYAWVEVGAVPSFGPPGKTFIGYLGSVSQIEKADGFRLDVGRFVPPPVHPATAPQTPLDMIADHLLMAHALVDEDGAKAALPGIRMAMLEVGRAMANRTKLKAAGLH